MADTRTNPLEDKSGVSRDDGDPVDGYHKRCCDCGRFVPKGQSGVGE